MLERIQPMSSTIRIVAARPSGIFIKVCPLRNAVPTRWRSIIQQGRAFESVPFRADPSEQVIVIFLFDHRVALAGELFQPFPVDDADVAAPVTDEPHPLQLV